MPARVWRGGEVVGRDGERPRVAVESLPKDKQRPKDEQARSAPTARTAAGAAARPYIERQPPSCSTKRKEAA